MRDYLIRYCKRMLSVKGVTWLDELLTLGKITQEEYNMIVGD